MTCTVTARAAELSANQEMASWLSLWHVSPHGFYHHKKVYLCGTFRTSWLLNLRACDCAVPCTRQRHAHHCWRHANLRWMFCEMSIDGFAWHEENSWIRISTSRGSPKELRWSSAQSRERSAEKKIIFSAYITIAKLTSWNPYASTAVTQFSQQTKRVQRGNEITRTHKSYLSST